MRLDSLGLPFAIFVDSDRLAPSDANNRNESMIATFAASGITAICTKKREIENYIDPALTTNAAYGDFDDAKKITAQADGLLKRGKPHKVMDTLWPQMTSAQIISRGNYTDAQGNTKSEIVEIIQNILAIS